MDRQFVEFLKRRPSERNDVELRYISYYLQTLPSVSHASQAAINALSRSVYYECRGRGENVYNAKDTATCWFVLLSGSVCVQTASGFHTFRPLESFGTDIDNDGKRGYACYAMEFAEFVVIDFPNTRLIPYPLTAESVASRLRAKGYTHSSHQLSHSNSKLVLPNPYHHSPQSIYDQANHSNTGAYLNLELMTPLVAIPGQKPPVPPHRPRPSSYNRLSLSSNGSSFLTSDGESTGSNPRLDEDYHVYSQVSKPTEKVYYCSPPEEELYADINYYDACFDELKILKKAPNDRSLVENKLLADFLQHFSAFSSLSAEMRLDFSTAMKYLHVEQKNKVVLQHGEQLDSWCVVINGQVENVKKDGSSRVFSTGQGFGLDRWRPIPQFHEGRMITLERDCQFVAIPEKEYFEVINKHSQYERVVCDGSRTVFVTESRELNNEKLEDESLVVKLGEPTRLVSHLIEDRSVSETSYEEDFLLTYRTFIKDPTYVSEKLEKWYVGEPANCVKERITKVVFAWVANHYIDFEANSSLSFFLENFYEKLSAEGKTRESSNLIKLCAKKGKTRKIELESVVRKDELPFSLVTPMGGNGSFIKTFKQKVPGLKVGDQLLAVNNKNVESMSCKETITIIASQEYCWLTVKHHVLGMKRVLTKQDSVPPVPAKKFSLPMDGYQDFLIRNGSSRATPVINAPNMTKHFEHKKLKKMAKKFPFLPPNPLSKKLNSTSNPDVSNLSPTVSRKQEEASDFALKVYTIDQAYKYLSFSELTSIRHIVNKACESLELENANDYVLYHVEVSVDGMVKQTRLAEQHKDIIDRIRPASRFYVKLVNDSNRLLPSEVAVELQKEANVQFLDLKPLELAIQLTIRDLTVVQKILPHQYIELLWKLPPKDCKYLSYTTVDDFTDLSNKEMFWVIHTVCAEKNLNRRVKIVKQFIKMAKYCRELRNFNSMFAILSGLGHNCVSRLDYTMEKIPSKESKLKSVLDEVLDPSRNMAKYRNLLTAYKGSTPVIPIYPIFIKDLTVYHLGNESKVGELINFEKLRLISKEIKCFYTSISSNPDRDFLKSLITKPNKVTNHPVPDRENPMELSKSVSDITGPPVTRNGFLHRSRKSFLSSNNNAKRIYEDILMSKRVEKYIHNLQVISDEEVLRKLSLECEPDERDFDIDSILPPMPVSMPDQVAVSSNPNPTSSPSDGSLMVSSKKNPPEGHYDVVCSDDISLSSGFNSLTGASEGLSLQTGDVSPRITLANHPFVSNALSSNAAHSSVSDLNFEKLSIASSLSPTSRLPQQGVALSRDSLSSNSSSGSRSKSTSRVDDKLMRIPATPSFATNKSIPVFSKKQDGAFSQGMNSPPLHSNGSLHPRSHLIVTESASTQKPRGIVYQSYPQGTQVAALQKPGIPQTGYARSISLASGPAYSSQRSNIVVPPKMSLKVDSVMKPMSWQGTNNE